MVVKTFLFYTVFFCFLSHTSKAQEIFSFEELSKMKQYKSLKKALKNPEKVYVLILQEQNLSTFPEEIFEFEHLQYLSLAGNPITEIPSRLTELKELQFLHMPLTQVATLPEEILNMPSLKDISVALTPLSNKKEEVDAISKKFSNANFRTPPRKYDSYTQIGIVGGFVFNPQQSFGELGVYWGKLDFLLLQAVSAGVEWNPRATAYKTALIWNGLLSFQLNALLLDNHKTQTFALRPELGLGLANISLTYGYNFFVPEDFEDTVEHVFTLRFAFPVSLKRRSWYKGRRLIW